MSDTTTPAERAAEKICNKHGAGFEPEDYAEWVMAVIAAEYASIEQENQRLREALGPFAKFGERLMDGRKQVPKSGAWYGLDSGTDKERTIDIEHFKAAVKALATDKRG